MPSPASDTLPFLALQHVSCEPPAAYGEVLEARGMTTMAVELGEGEPLPTDPTAFAGVIAMGGPMGVYETDKHPWLGLEVEFLEAALAADVPIWGVCFGAQLLAAALGAEVRPGPAPEVGVSWVRLTEAAAVDPAFAGAPAEFQAFHWHGDTYDLPNGAVRLAETDIYPEQAFRHGRSIALQFHLEVTPELAGEWAEIPVYAKGMEQALGPGALPRQIERIAEIAPAATALGRHLFSDWLEEVLPS